MNDELVLSAGVGKIDITPPLGKHVQGGLEDKGTQFVFEKLYAKALVFDNGREQLVLITSDLIGVSPELTAAIRKGVAKILKGIKPANIMVSATHTHCGPVILPKLIGEGTPDSKYLRSLQEKMVQAVSQAISNLEPVKIGRGLGQAFFNINRRLKTPKEILFAPNPKGVCDREVGVIRIDTLKGDPKAILFNYTCHPTTMGGAFTSPDYPGFAQKTIEAKHKNKVVALFTNGACGDIRPCTTKGKTPKTFGGGTKFWVKKLGMTLGNEVLRVARTIQTKPVGTLKSASVKMALPLAKPASVSALTKEIRDTQDRIKLYKAEKRSAAYLLYEGIGLSWAKNTLRLIRNKKFPKTVQVEAQIFQIGDLNLVGLAGEIFCDIGLAIKKMFRPQKSFVVGYANGDIGYIPTAKAVLEGGYETDRSFKSYNVSAGFSTKVEKIVLNTVKELHEKL
ncbi:MAG: neutral/alkaline non-lysosomal ceramidase N-terminal domain-containing protein [Phycisphaerae bacterium]